LQAEINQLGRQFWVDKKQVVANKYDLSASRYRDVEQDEEFLEKPAITLGRLAELEQRAAKEVVELQKLLARS
jgi:type I restriction enzyme M protein